MIAEGSEHRAATGTPQRRRTGDGEPEDRAGREIVKVAKYRAPDSRRLISIEPATESFAARFRQELRGGDLHEIPPSSRKEVRSEKPERSHHDLH